MENSKYLTKKVSLLILFTAIVGGIGGAILLGHLLETIARSIFGLSEWDIPYLLLWGSFMLLLATAGTLALVGAVYTENKIIRWLIIVFSIPLPIVFEIVDLTVRMIALVNEAYVYYGLT